MPWTDIEDIDIPDTAALARFIAGRTADRHVVVTPIVKTHAGRDAESYFLVATNRAGKGFGVDQIICNSNFERADFIMRLADIRPPVTVHVFYSELAAAFFCCKQWPCDETKDILAELGRGTGNHTVH